MPINYKAMSTSSKFSFLFVLFAVFFFAGCADELDIQNPNEPQLDILNTEDGIRRAMLGTYDFRTEQYTWYALTHHEVMGDVLYVPWGNVSWRWSAQPTSITLDDGTVTLPPEGGAQGQELALRNTRGQGRENAFFHEWAEMYRINNVGNLLLERVNGGTIAFAENEENKTATIRAFARFWKGFAYSRIGSMYSAGLINDVFSETTDVYVDRTVIIDEANNQLDFAIEALDEITDETVYADVLASGIPDYMRPDGVPSPAEFIRNINTLKARNLLVNTRANDLTDEEWEVIQNLAAAGLEPGDVYLQLRTAAQNAAFDDRPWPRWAVLNFWAEPSERLVQDFKAGDQRFARNFALRDQAQVNQAGRGIQFGTRYSMIDIVDGGDIASQTPGVAVQDLAGSWEESALMEAEALINLGQVDDGLTLVDEVRAAQNAGLDAVADDDLEESEAYEELRRERRIGLLLRSVAFYDARRWGVIDPVSSGGGRTGAVMLDASGNLNTNATINYNYLNYWGVPENELDFNAPSEGSASILPE